MLFWLFGLTGAVLAANLLLWAVTSTFIGLDKSGGGDFLIPPLGGALFAAFLAAIFAPVLMFAIKDGSLETYGNIVAICTVIGAIGGVIFTINEQDVLQKLKRKFRSRRKGTSSSHHQPWQIERTAAGFQVQAKRGSMVLDLPIYSGSLAPQAVNQEMFFGDLNFGHAERSLRKSSFVAAVEAGGGWRYVRLRPNSMSLRSGNTLVVDVIQMVDYPDG